MSAATARLRQAVRLAGFALVVVWTAWSALHMGQQLATFDFRHSLLRPPDPGISGSYLEMAGRQQRAPGSVGVVWLLPGDHEYWGYWFDYHFASGRVTFYPDLPAAAAARPRYIVVVSLPGDEPVDPAGYVRDTQERRPDSRITGYERRSP